MFDFGGHVNALQISSIAIRRGKPFRYFDRDPGEAANVFGEHGDDALEDEAAGAGAVFAAKDEGVEGVGDIFGGFASDLDPVMAEERLERAREEEIERGVAGGEVGQGQAMNGRVGLRVEIVDPEFIEVAKN